MAGAKPSSKRSRPADQKSDQRATKKFAGKSKEGDKPHAKPIGKGNSKFSDKSKSKYPNKQGKVAPQPSTPAESRKIQQQKREYRKSLRTHHDLVTQAKTYWERIRDTVNVAAAERTKLIDELLSIIKGLLMDLIRKHDGSRIIQTCIKYGNARQRKLIFAELEGHFLELAEKKYSRFLVNRFIDSASKPQREIIFKEFYGKVISMIKHKDACEVIEKAYSVATGFQKTLFVEEFYGNEFALFKAAENRHLADILKENPEKQEQIMENISTVINILLTKGLIYLSISHHVLTEFYNNATPEQIREMTGLLAPELIHTVRTKYGAQVAAKCVGFATAKERKIIIKSLKGNVAPICQEPYGHMLIVKLLSVTDDTVLLSKTIVKEMMEGIDDLLTDGNGRLPFLIILAPEANRTRYFAPNSMELLAPNEVPGPGNTMIPSSKKDPEVRRGELLAEIGPNVLEHCASHVDVLIRDKFGFAVLLEAMLHAEGDKATIVDEIIKLIKMKPSTEDHIMSHPVASRFVKTLVANNFSYGEENILFAKTVLDNIKDFMVWATMDYASAIIVALLKNEKTGPVLRKLLKPKVKELKKSDVRGTEAIVALLTE